MRTNLSFYYFFNNWFFCIIYAKETRSINGLQNPDDWNRNAFTSGLPCLCFTLKIVQPRSRLAFDERFYVSIVCLGIVLPRATEKWHSISCRALNSHDRGMVTCSVVSFTLVFLSKHMQQQYAILFCLQDSHYSIFSWMNQLEKGNWLVKAISITSTFNGTSTMLLHIS